MKNGQVILLEPVVVTPEPPKLKLINLMEEPLRYFIGAGGIEWFLANDVGDILGLSAAKWSLRDFPENEKLRCTVSTSGQRREMLFVNEPGLYRLIFQSRRPEAEAFKTRVFREVLPALRKTGSYARPVGEARPELLALPAGRREEVSDLLDLMESIEAASNRRGRIREIAASRAGVWGFSKKTLTNKFCKWLKCGRDWHVLDRWHVMYRL